MPSPMDNAVKRVQGTRVLIRSARGALGEPSGGEVGFASIMTVVEHRRSFKIPQQSRTERRDFRRNGDSEGLIRAARMSAPTVERLGESVFEDQRAEDCASQGGEGIDELLVMSAVFVEAHDGAA